MKKKKIGIYLGTEGIGMAEVSGVQLVSSTHLTFPISDLETSEKSLELESLIKEGFKNLKVSSKEVFLGFSERELIFRFLELPLMRRSEVLLSLPLEVERYMPFKIDELFWNFCSLSELRTKKIKVAFLGGKKERIEAILNFLESIGYKVNSVESGSLSLAGLLKYFKIVPPTIKNFSLCLVSQKENEFYIFERNLPRLGRFIRLALNGEGLIQKKRLLDELILSFDYYRRELKGKEVNILYVIGEERDIEFFSDLKSELDLNVELMSIQEISRKLRTDRTIENLEELKAYSLALGRRKPSLFTLNIIKPKKELLFQEEAEKLKEIVPLNFFTTLLLPVFLGLFILGWIWFTEKKKLSFFDLKLKEVNKELKELPVWMREFSLKELNSKLGKLKEKKELLEKLTDFSQDTFEFFKALSSSRSRGMWFEELTFSRDLFSQRLDITLTGFIYLGDPNKERRSFDRFLSSLRSSDFLKKRGLEVSLNLRSTTKEGFVLTRFEIKIH